MSSDRNLVANFGMPTLEIANATVTKPSAKVQAVAISIKNSGLVTVSSVMIVAKKEATLDGKATSDRMPIVLGDIAPGATGHVTVNFSGVKSGPRTLALKLTYTGGTVTRSFNVTVP